ncbi:uncharacterized protein [Arachis hypogaea]|uniref:uncharacterized protein n=1 Tax=Arachis hypogaea TaxID=3818 RepID=UPI003B217234
MVGTQHELQEGLIVEGSSRVREFDDDDESTSSIPHDQEDRLPHQEVREDLKHLPPHVKYAFLDKKHKFSVIVGTDLSNQKEQQHLEVNPITDSWIDILDTSKFIELQEVFIYDFSVYGSSFDDCLGNLTRVLERYPSKIDVISSLPYPFLVREIRSYLGHVCFYRRFIKNFCQVALPLFRLLQKDEEFYFDEDCKKTSDKLKDELTTTPIVRGPNWNQPFEIMSYASKHAVGAALAQRDDFMGPFSNSNGFVYIFLAVDYVSKWVEAIPTRCDDANTVASFLRNNIICKFGSPRAIVSDKGIHFCNRKIEVLMKKYEVLHKVFTSYHPQTNRQAEVSNREIKRILEKVVNPQRKGWNSRLGDALWAYRTAYKNPIRMSPFRIVFGKPCHLPVEIQHKTYWAVKLCNPDLKGAGIECKLQLEELECLRLEAYENSKFYKEKAKTFHDQNIRRRALR